MQRVPGAQKGDDPRILGEMAASQSCSTMSTSVVHMQGFLKCLCLVAWKPEAVGFCGWSGEMCEMLMAERQFSPWRWGINRMQINAIIAWRYDEMDLPESNRTFKSDSSRVWACLRASPVVLLKSSDWKRQCIVTWLSLELGKGRYFYPWLNNNPVLNSTSMDCQSTLLLMAVGMIG